MVLVYTLDVYIAILCIVTEKLYTVCVYLCIIINNKRTAYIALQLALSK